MGLGDEGLRAVFVLFRGLLGMVLLLISGIGIWLIVSAAGPLVKTHFRFDLSQAYRGVEQSDRILFYDRESLYRRNYRGLEEIYSDPEWFLPYNDDMVWYGGDGKTVYVWPMDMGIQCIDMEDFSVREAASKEDVEKTGAVHEISRLSQARHCMDWNDGEGFTYWLDGVIYRYTYRTKENCEIGKSQDGYGLTDHELYYLAAEGEEQNLMQKSSSGEIREIADNVSVLTAGPDCRVLLYYSIDDERYHLYDTRNGEDKTLPPDLILIDPVISPDGSLVLYQEIEYRSSVTDDEECYYRVLNLVTNEVTTIYSGYREWLGYIW